MAKDDKQDKTFTKTLRPQRLTPEEIRDGCIHLTGDDGEETRICVVNEEFRQGIDFISQFERTATFFGSARLPEDSPYYEKARECAERLVKELGYTVVTGGGPGIMEAANRGAKEAKGDSIGINIQLPHEQTLNPYTTDSIGFYYFFTRKVTLTFSAEVYVFFPGGFGTLDEFFEILTLEQTGKIGLVPIVLFGTEFWQPLLSFIDEVLATKFQTISPSDMRLYRVTDDLDEVMRVAKDAPPREA